LIVQVHDVSLLSSLKEHRAMSRGEGVKSVGEAPATTHFLRILYKKKTIEKSHKTFMTLSFQKLKRVKRNAKQTEL